MSKNFNFFLIAFFVSLLFWWGVNVSGEKLENFFFWQEISENPQIFTAQLNLEKKLENLKPVRNREIGDLEIGAKSAISVLINNEGNPRILFEKGGDKRLPIASLTKLMTVSVVLENYDLTEKVEISKEAVLQESEFGNLKIGEEFFVKDLLYPLLMESSNDAAYALSETIGEEEFVDLMNIKAANLGLENTFFLNPTGLDPDNLSDLTNYSTAKDLVKLTNYLLKNQPLIWDILGTFEFDLYSSDGVLHHRLKNTNELLKEGANIIGGKTGWTPQAQGCLLLVYGTPQNRGKIINVILGSEDRFGEMKKLINWLNQVYRW